ncbi:MAG: hypothetical protein NWE92_12520 [Candidatus Bathyarchaeota archaeon]|nr:hypothetical protein [Candidatus Bathyarchaeota archaeon]
MKSKKYIVLFLTIAMVGTLLAATSYAALSSSKTFPASGRIVSVNVGVYTDSACTQQATAIDWGSLEPGENKTVTLYIKNTGNSPVTLGMTTNTWSPSDATQSISISWNRNGAVLAAGAVVSANVQLTISPTTTLSDFSFNIVITGSRS